jgi:hypothetical protein
MISRAEHLAWCKERALALVDAGEGAQAMASMISDLGKHPATQSNLSVVGLLVMTTNASDLEEVRSFVNGFN